LLVQLDGVNFLTDPTWAERTGPFGGLVGVARYTPPPMRVEDLPPIDFVLISHDHYDHLDEPTVRYLARLQSRVLRSASNQALWGMQCRGADWGESVR
jgi:L-ascorbate metabolism protein UlaG (beta-lactamase superfamily)